MRFDTGMQASAMRVHRHHRGEILYLGHPHRFRHTEIKLIHPQDFYDSLSNQRGCPTDGVQINSWNFLTSCQCLRSHATLTNHTLNIEVLHNHSLVRFFTNAGGGSSSNKLVILGIQASDYRATMVNYTASQQGFNGR